MSQIQTDKSLLKKPALTKQPWVRTTGKEPLTQKNQEPKDETPAENSAKNHEKKAVQNFRDLKVWQLGKEIVAETYKLTRGFPNEELYGLVAQMRRAAISIPCNISEGHSRRATRDYQRFLKMAAGSCAELETQMEIATDLNYLKLAACEAAMEKLSHERRMLRKLICKLSENGIRHPSSVEP